MTIILSQLLLLLPSSDTHSKSGLVVNDPLGFNLVAEGSLHHHQHDPYYYGTYTNLLQLTRQLYHDKDGNPPTSSSTSSTLRVVTVTLETDDTTLCCRTHHDHHSPSHLSNEFYTVAWQFPNQQQRDNDDMASQVTTSTNNINNNNGGTTTTTTTLPLTEPSPDDTATTLTSNDGNDHVTSTTTKVGVP